MAGIYFHIPFCKKACYYCDFHFSTSLKYKDELLASMHRELELQKGYLQGHVIETIYFGGGTPSVLNASEIQKLIDHVADTRTVLPNAEITMEANPDDLSAAHVGALRNTSVNRFSIGIQSFYEEDLQWMNRAHSAAEADSSVKRVQDAGFENITLDLIYGFPLLTDEKWQANIRKVIELEVPHISAYSMTVEDRTALAHFIKKGKQPTMNESQSAQQFVLLMDTLKEAGYEHYEISNFARPGKYSRHNTNYWKGIPYLGIGPSAHSFNGISRQWNIANNPKYIESLSQDTLPAEIEILSLADRINEYIMTSLRTMWGMDLNKVEQDFGYDYRNQTEINLQEFIGKRWIEISNNTAILTNEGRLFADHIASSLFFEQE
ncbi:oxygen-independent coproporphyrinogen-3 oxidase [Arcticibacter tournemirensis]|uniref:Heme chaperone HemW n=1 Tax=Arcticibacter tournemirensis TaxID=699437 RepID=A0A5M9H1G2_9SPHI|nr:radical SAM family heme chaperone HemW [Arcticibacter tournemirensis]KAA8478938.1 radical SAM family heme chaperone HemW [Arcticibacter tournemirensis]TQM49159.1 oxygen-independent coproporphyrinogen-3 oxidase [Arcticibacter tournemirensis]